MIRFIFKSSYCNYQFKSLYPNVYLRSIVLKTFIAVTKIDIMMISVLGSLLVPFILLQRLNEVEVVEFDALVCEVRTQKLELVVTERDLVVVKN